MATIMRALRIVAIGQPLALCEVPMPEPGPGEIRVKLQAAGICHSDAHYRDGTGSVGFLPISPGHEVAGVVDKLGAQVADVAVGDRVALHYLVTCGQCDYCARGLEQFCRHGRMLGKDMHGGFAEYIVAPARNAIPIDEAVDVAAAAIMMCSSATAFHALRQARMRAGDRVAVFGVGGLGMSALQLARACGAAEVYAIDVDPAKLKAAQAYGAHAIDPADGAPDQQLRTITQGRGVDVALEFAGLPVTQHQALASLAVHGRLALAGISRTPFAVDSYATVINREVEIIGVSDHLHGELSTLMEFARRGLLDLDSVIAERMPLDAERVNDCLDALAVFRGRTRSVIVFD